MRRIYHFATPSAWEKDAPGPYRADSLATEGFIHCSNADQVAWAANRFYPDAAELSVLVIDADRLTSTLKDEAAGQWGVFPHIYGPINRKAVVEIRPLERGADGRWAFPD